MICKCGHEAEKHHHLKSCTAIIDEVKLKYCKCDEFQEVKAQTSNQNGDDEMTKKQKAIRKKGEGRIPTLAQYVKEGFNIFGTYKGKELEARVRADGMVIFRDKEYASPSLACMAYINRDGEDRQVNGWFFWNFKKDGEEVSLNTLRGPKFAKKAATPKKPRPAKRAKANGAQKPKKRRQKTPLAVQAAAAQERAARSETQAAATA